MQKLLTVEDVADQLSISRSLVYELEKSDEIPSHRIGRGRGCLRFAQADVTLYVHERRQEGRKVTPKPRVGKLKHLRIKSPLPPRGSS